jgi:chromosome segregation ATPase
MKDDLAYEKDRNQKLKQAMHELNTQIISMKEDIRSLDEEQQALLRQNHEIKYTL